MRTLYFDIDGTLLLGSFGDPKPALVDGAFERAVRRAGIERLVCVGNVVHIVRTLESSKRPIDGHATIFRTCQGVFQDERWFRSVTSLVLDPSERARHIELGGDWYWVDDLAERYCEHSQLTPLFEAHAGGRIFVPVPDGDGEDVLTWLGRLPG